MLIMRNRADTERGRRKRETRGRIVEVAARLMRERGFASVGVAEVMAEAGLTHGAFYAHFDSKDALAAAALAESAQSSRSRYFAGLRGRVGRDWLSSAVRRYLSRAHRDDPSDGCPYPTLAADSGRSPDDRLRITFDAELRESARAFERELIAAGADAPGDEALGLLALCAGGVALARAVEDPQLSDRILAGARKLAEAALPGTPEPSPAAKAAARRNV